MTYQLTTIVHIFAALLNLSVERLLSKFEIMQTHWNTLEIFFIQNIGNLLPTNYLIK
jgi:hypothetical protein